MRIQRAFAISVAGLLLAIAGAASAPAWSGLINDSPVAVAAGGGEGGTNGGGEGGTNGGGEGGTAGTPMG